MNGSHSCFFESRRVALDGKRFLHYRRRGRGPAVVLLHGIPGSGCIWDGVAAALADTYTVYVPDLLGFGGSSRSASIDDLDMPTQAAAVGAMLDSEDVTRAVWVGHDYGGPITLTAWMRQRERIAGVVLAATNAHTDTPIPFPLSGMFWPLVGGLWQRMLFSRPMLRSMLRMGVGRGGPRLDAAQHVGDRAQAQAIATIFAASLCELEARYAETEAALKTVDVPRHVVWGDRDPFFEVAAGRRIAADMHAAFTLLDGAGHFLPAERPEPFAAVVRDVAAASFAP